MISYPTVKVASAHLAPVWLDLSATVDKACSVIAEAAANGAALVAFPETYVPAFPVWAALAAPIRNHDFFRRLAANTLRVPGPEIERLAAAARQAGLFVSIGINEGTDASVGCIWNANLLIGPDGRVLNHHRKLVPTFWEKLVWANGDGAGLRVVDTPIGRIGALICGENTNPLARFSLIAQGEQIHVASYPPVWPTKDPGSGGNYDLASAIRIRAGAHSFEGKLFTVVSAGFMDKAMRHDLATMGEEAARILDNTPRGVSMVIGPTGEPVSDTLCEEEGLLYAEIDIGDCVEPKQFHDVAGYYNRFDVFQLSVNRRANRPVQFDDGVAAEGGAHASADQPAETETPDAPPEILSASG